jgi:hypothetical protein
MTGAGERPRDPWWHRWHHQPGHFAERENASAGEPMGALGMATVVPGPAGTTQAAGQSGPGSESPSSSDIDRAAATTSALA